MFVVARVSEMHQREGVVHRLRGSGSRAEPRSGMERAHDASQGQVRKVVRHR
jgi:hypothetical protein